MSEAEIIEPEHWFSEESATFGDRLAGAREALGLSQQDLAAQIGVKLRTVLDWENDLNDPRANKLQMLSGVLNVSIAWLLTGEGDGVDAPATTSAQDSEDILSEMRMTRQKIAELTQHLGALENRLRTSLRA